jgi:hypothetical protein
MMQVETIFCCIFFFFPEILHVTFNEHTGSAFFFFRSYQCASLECRAENTGGMQKGWGFFCSRFFFLNLFTEEPMSVAPMSAYVRRSVSAAGDRSARVAGFCSNIGKCPNKHRTLLMACVLHTQRERVLSTQTTTPTHFFTVAHSLQKHVL